MGLKYVLCFALKSLRNLVEISFCGNESIRLIKYSQHTVSQHWQLALSIKAPPCADTAAFCRRFKKHQTSSTHRRQMLPI